MQSQQTVIVVAGLPRSGTSMMMKMLEAGGLPILADQVRGADIDNPKGYYEFERVKRLPEDTAWLPQAVGKAVKMVSMLLYDLPTQYHYQIIFMRRRMNEILASQKTMLLRRNRDMLVDDEEMEELFTKHLTAVQSWLKQQAQLDVLEVWYNDLLKQPQTEAKRVCEFLGKKLNTTAMMSVIDRSLYRNRTRQ